MSLLEVKDLCRTFWQGDTAIHAVDHVNFSLNKGEMLAIVGQSGSGKTTLLNLLDGVDKPTSGHVLLDGQDIHSLSDKQSAQLRRRNAAQYAAHFAYRRSHRARYKHFPAHVFTSVCYFSLPHCNVVVQRYTDNNIKISRRQAVYLEIFRQRKFVDLLHSIRYNEFISNNN